MFNPQLSQDEQENLLTTDNEYFQKYRESIAGAIMQQALEQEIEELERKIAEPLTSDETRYLNQIKVTLLRNGYRLLPNPIDHRILLVIVMETQEVIHALSAQELQCARFQDWLSVVKAYPQRHKEP